MTFSLLPTQNINEICLKVLEIAECEFISGKLPVYGVLEDELTSLLAM